MGNVLPKGVTLSIKGETGKFPIDIITSENLHFETVHNDTPEQVTNQLQVAGLLNLVKEKPVLVDEDGTFNAAGSPFNSTNPDPTADDAPKPKGKKGK